MATVGMLTLFSQSAYASGEVIRSGRGGSCGEPGEEVERVNLLHRSFVLSGRFWVVMPLWQGAEHSPRHLRRILSRGPSESVRHGRTERNRCNRAWESMVSVVFGRAPRGSVRRRSARPHPPPKMLPARCKASPATRRTSGRNCTR